VLQDHVGMIQIVFEKSRFLTIFDHFFPMGFQWRSNGASCMALSTFSSSVPVFFGCCWAFDAVWGRFEVFLGFSNVFVFFQDFPYPGTQGPENWPNFVNLPGFLGHVCHFSRNCAGSRRNGP